MDANAADLTTQWIEFWKYAGTACAILLAVFGLVIVHYLKVILPREQAKTDDQRMEAKARADALTSMAKTNETVGDCIVRYDMRFDLTDQQLKDLKGEVSGVRKHIERFRRRSDGTISVIDE